MKTLSIIIPTYNEEKYIKDTIQKVKNTPLFNLKREIIVVNDASLDSTQSILESIPDIHIITSTRNEGKGASIKKGLLSSTGDVVVIQEADFEYDPSELP